MNPVHTTCSKRYDDFPFAHRQPNHKGHCAYIHGHNWSFEFTFGAHQLDECGFVVDFGKLKPLKAYLTEMFDHTTVVNEDDPLLPVLRSMKISKQVEGIPDAGMFDLREIPDCSCEGIAKFMLEAANSILADLTMERAYVLAVKVYEDTKNSAVAYCEPPLPVNTAGPHPDENADQADYEVHTVAAKTEYFNEDGTVGALRVVQRDGTATNHGNVHLIDRELRREHSDLAETVTADVLSTMGRGPKKVRTLADEAMSRYAQVDVG